MSRTTKNNYREVCLRGPVATCNRKWKDNPTYRDVRQSSNAQGSQELIRSTAAERNFALCEMSIFERLRNSMKTKPTAKEPSWDFCFWFAVYIATVRKRSKAMDS
jgi:hypothetical protein